MIGILVIGSLRSPPPYPGCAGLLHGKACHTILRSLRFLTNRVPLPPHPGDRINRSMLSCRDMDPWLSIHSPTACGGSPAQRARGRRAERALPADRYLQADETLSSCTRILPCVQNDHVRREGNPVTSCFPLRGIPAKRERVYEAARDIDTLSWYGTAVRRHFYSSPPKAAIHNPQPPKAAVSRVDGIRLLCPPLTEPYVRFSRIRLLE